MTGPLPPLTSIPRDLVSAGDYARRAQDHLPPATLAYLEGGAGDEITLRENTAAFSALKLAPRQLVDVKGGHTHLSLAGEPLAHPFLLAPVGWQRLFHPGGELEVARAAQAMDTVFAVSAVATTAIEALVAPGGAPVWFQIYMQASRETTAGVVRRAEAAGCRALIVTVDAPLAGLRNREQRAGFALPGHLKAENMPEVQPIRAAGEGAGVSRVFDQAMHTAPTWKDVDWLVRQTQLPVWVKGILHPDDAARAVEAGAAGIVVSNHGGRVLDTAPAALHVLPAVAARLNGAVPILFDSGIRRGADAFKAIALGASAVMVGRPYIHALAVAGALGVAHLLRTLREELEITMALTGCARLADITADHLWRSPESRA
jgi:4-hydroxymandelate oxidase